jgi:serine/threonine-protein kinase
MEGKLLDRRYRIKNFIAKGLGNTYLAEDTKRPGNPTCVVKKLIPHNSKIFPVVKRLFIREAEVLEDLGKHPQIPLLLAYFDENEDFYLVQEYIEGKTLENTIAIENTLSEERVATLLYELLNILDFVHQKKIIHRDIKPANIIIRAEDGKPVLIDFGAVKKIYALNSQKTIIGTPGYIPEEQFRGMPSFGSDLYALGITCIQALTGIHPKDNSFRVNKDKEIIWQDKVRISFELASILTKMIRQDSHNRYQSAREVLEDLNKLNNVKKEIKESDILPTLELNNSTSSWQKYKLPIIASATIIVIGGISIPLINRYTIAYAPQLTLNNKAIASALNENSQIEPIKNTYSDVYLFNGRKNQQITIELNSEQFDPSLTILKPDRQMLASNDDISPDNFNSKITVTLPEDGKYQAIVRASQSGEMGEYQLKASIE